MENWIYRIFRRCFVAELDKYLNSEMEMTIKAITRLWGKYAVSAETMTAVRTAAEDKLDAYLKELGYYG